MEIQNNELRIQIPQNMEIDKENSTFECIKFKPIEKKRWRDNENIILTGYCVTFNSSISEVTIDCKLRNIKGNFNVFATEKQAKSALAMARISQIMANDERFGGVVTDEEWKNITVPKYIIIKRTGSKYNIIKDISNYRYNFLAFHTPQQRELFLEENADLVKDYLMID